VSLFEARNNGIFFFSSKNALWRRCGFAWAAPVGLILNNVIWIGFLCGGERWFLVLVYFLGLMRRLMDFDKWSSINFPIT
jgi:hypothetical protein